MGKASKTTVFKCTVALLALLLFGRPLPVLAQPAGQIAARFSAEQIAAIAREAEQAAAEILESTGGSAVSVALGDGDGLLWSGQYGFADKDARAAPKTETMFGIGSTSKMFATAATMILVDRGLVNLDARLIDYLPNFRMASPGYEKITVRMLLNHSAGFPGSDYRNAMMRAPGEGYPEQVLATLADSRLKHEPGWMSVYANDGFTLVELLVKAMTGMEFTEFVDREILKPLGMEHSKYPLDYFSQGSYALTYKENKVQTQEFLGPLGSGGLYSTPSDLTRFAAMLLGKGSFQGKRVLSPQAVEAMGEDQTKGKFNPIQENFFRFGLGWDSINQPGMATLGLKAWEKGGDTYSYGAMLIVLPDEGLSAAVTGASGVNSDTASAIAERILARALVEKGRLDAMPGQAAPTELPTAALPAELAESIPGVYVSFSDVMKFDIDAQGILSMYAHRSGSWVKAFEGLSYRSDGWFVSSVEGIPPLLFSFIRSDGRAYVAMRMPSTNGWHRNTMIFAQKLEKAKPLSSAWQSRIGKTWLPINFSSADAYLSPNTDPRFKLLAVDGAEGYIFSSSTDGLSTTLPKEEGDDEARSFILIPGINGRDLYDVTVFRHGDEEWLRGASTLYRPLDTVPVSTQDEAAVTIGPEGYTEWRRLPAETKFTVEGATAVKIYDEGFASLDPEAGKVGTGGAYLAIFGAPGSTVNLSVKPLGLTTEQKARIAEAGAAAAEEVLKASGGSSLTAAVVDENGIIWSGQFGLADKEKNLAPGSDTMFGIGSVSKMFAATATMMLVDRGLVQLDAPLSTYLKDFTMVDPRYKDITVRMILNHSAGLPGADLRNAGTLIPYEGLARQALKTLASQRLKHAPGFMAVYTNDGFTLVELLVEAVSGQKFTDFVEKEIFQPLGMEHSRYPVGEFSQDSYAHIYAGDEAFPYFYLNMYGSGALYSIPSDLARFSMMLALGGEYAGKRILSESAVHQMGLDQTAGSFNPLPTDYMRFGLGWDTVAQPGMNAVELRGWQKGGDVTGFYGATMIVLPDQKMAAVVMGASGVSSIGSGEVAETLLLHALVEKGILASMPARASAAAAARRIPDLAERFAIEGYYAASGSLVRARFGADQMLGIEKLSSEGWIPLATGLSARTDGWYSSDLPESSSFRFINTEQGRYINQRTNWGYGHYAITIMLAQKLETAPPLPKVWEERSFDTWLLANETPLLALPGDDTDPRLIIGEIDELPGYLIYDWEGKFVVRPVSADDSLASMFLLIPGIQGRDLNDLSASIKAGIEYLAVGGAQFRAASSVPKLEKPAGGNETRTFREIRISPQGLGEWIRIPAPADENSVLFISGSKLWRLYNEEFNLVAEGTNDGDVDTAGMGKEFWLVTYGEAESMVRIAR